MELIGARISRVQKTDERQIISEEKTMNCDLCGQHILATMQIAWHGGNYHPDCIGEAVNRNRARQDIPPAEFNAPDDYFHRSDGEDLEFQDDIDEFEEDFADAIERFDDSPIIPETVESDFQPERREVHINEAAASAAQSFIENRQGISRNGVGTLIAGRDTRFVPREFLSTIPTPESTDTFKPIPHAELINQIMDSLWYRRMNVVRDEYAVSSDGMKMFGLIELDIEYKGVRFAIGIRNANDKSMRVAMVAGYKVTVCSNMMLQGDFNPMLSKHSKNFDLQDNLSIACDRIQRNFGNLHREITAKQERIIEPAFARELCYKAFTEGKFPISLLRTVHHEYFEKPSYEEFAKPTLWSLENAFTTAFKKLEPVAQFQATAKFGKFLASFN
jgi:hypothetical protein